MALAIKIDQSGKAAGVAGRAREDLSTGTAVTLTAVGGPFSQYRWRIISKPINILVPSRSSAVLSAPNAPSTTLTPIDVAGPHLVELAVNSGSGLGAMDADIVRITFYAGPTLAANPSDFPQREPAAFESIEHNVPDILDPAGNPDGWARTWKKWFAIIRSLWFGKSWANGRITNPSGVPSLVRSNGIAGVASLAPDRVAVTFITPMPDVLYSVIVSAVETASSPSGNLLATATNLTVNGFEISTFDASGTAGCSDVDMCFRVELGV